MHVEVDELISASVWVRKFKTYRVGILYREGSSKRPRETRNEKYGAVTNAEYVASK